MPEPSSAPSGARVAVGLIVVLTTIAVTLQLTPVPGPPHAAAIDQPTGNAQATVETDPVLESGDAADDAAIWYDQANPSRSVVIGNNKKGTLEVYGLDGHRIQRITGGFFGNVDVRRGFVTGTGPADLAVVWRSGIRVFRVNPGTRTLTNITDTSTGSIPVPTGGEGLCLYRSPTTGRMYTFVNSRAGHVAQYELTDNDGDGRVEGTLRRDWAIGSETEGCVADDELGHFYISEEGTGIWKYSAEPDAPVGTGDRTLVDTTVERGGHILPDVEGLTIVYQPGGTGYLMASSQAASDELNSVMVYERQDGNAFVRSFQVEAGELTDNCGRTDGIDALAADLGPAFPFGVFVCQDNANTAPAPGNQNFKLVPLERVVGLAGAQPPTSSTTTTTDPPDESSTTSTTEVPEDTSTSSSTSSTSTSTTSTTTTTTPSTTTTSTSTTTTTTTTSTTTTTTTPPASSISFVDRAVSNANARTHTVTIPSSVRAGDTMLLLIATNTTGTIGSPTGVTGWTQLSSLAAGSGRSAVWRRTATSADAGRAVRVTISSMTKANFVVAAYRGVSTSSPVAAFATATSTSGRTHATPTVSISRAGSWVVSYWTHKDSSTTTLTAPSGVQVRSNSTQSGSGRVVGLVADSGGPVPTGSYGGLNATGAANASSAHMWSIVLAGA